MSSPHFQAAPSLSGRPSLRRTLVLGLGNALLTDDAVGPLVAARLRELLPQRGFADVEVDEDQRGGLQLMERLVGYDRAIIIDAIRTGDAAPGTILRLKVNSIPTQHSASAHDANLATALALGRTCGAELPADDGIMIIGVEAADVFTFSEECTAPVAAALPRVLDEVLDILQRWRNEP